MSTTTTSANYALTENSQRIIPYRLTNDYMFRAVMQKNHTALKYLLACLLGISVEFIQDIQILNPIILGEAIDEKTCILDLKLKLNNQQIINLEMQVVNQKDWPERSLYYLSRAFCNLHKGDTYTDILPCIHIGILNFTLFPESPEFYSEYYMQNKKTHKIYSDKFAIRVLDLTQIEAPEVREEHPEIYYWARLFTAHTWEEIEMLSSQSEGIHEAVVTLKELTEDEKIQLQCEAREMYEHTMASVKKAGKMEGLAEGRTKGLAEGRTKGLAEGRTKGLAEGKIEVARNMLQKGMNIPDICELTGLTESDVKQLL